MPGLLRPQDICRRNAWSKRALQDPETRIVRKPAEFHAVFCCSVPSLSGTSAKRDRPLEAGLPGWPPGPRDRVTVSSTAAAELDAKGFKQPQPSDSRPRKPQACRVQRLLGPRASPLHKRVSFVVDAGVDGSTLEGALAPF